MTRRQVAGIARTLGRQVERLGMDGPDTRAGAAALVAMMEARRAIDRLVADMARKEARP